MTEDWVFNTTEHNRGSLTACMYEVTDGVLNSDRKAIRVELTVPEMIRLQEAVNHALAFHLRIMA